MLYVSLKKKKGFSPIVYLKKESQDSRNFNETFRSSATNRVASPKRASERFLGASAFSRGETRTGGRAKKWPGTGNSRERESCPPAGGILGADCLFIHQPALIYPSWPTDRPPAPASPTTMRIPRVASVSLLIAHPPSCSFPRRRRDGNLSLDATRCIRDFLHDRRRRRGGEFRNDDVG